MKHTVAFALVFGLLWAGVAHAGDGAKTRATKTKATSIQWSSVTKSPRPASASGRDAALYRLCGARDLGLVQVAATIVRHRVDGKPPLSERSLKTLTRATGIPQVWPRAWSLQGEQDDQLVAAKMRRWLVRDHHAPLRRCGIARGVSADGKAVIAAVTVIARADLAPIPRRTATSRWLSLEARLHVAASHAKVVLLGPRGRPKRVLASLSHNVVRSRFSLDQPGRWLIQVVAVMPRGPKPILEAEVFVDVDPPAVLDEAAPPGTSTDNVGTLFSRLNRARASEGLSALRHDKHLDRVALSHARAMARARRVAHDVGDGSPDERVASAGVRARRVGENIASAPALDRIHRALWESPSHRENMLDASFRRVGVAAVADTTGKLWAVQLYAD